MKMLIVLGIVVMVFTSCAVLTPQETQQERERLLASYDAAREKHSPEKVKEAIKDLLVGKWQYIGLEVEQGGIAVKRPEQMPQQIPNSPSSAVDELSKATTGKEAIALDAPEQAATPNLEIPEIDAQPSDANVTRLPPVEVIGEESNQQILGAKAALVASTRKNLVLEFFKDRGSYHYKGSNSGRNATGQCYVTTKRYGDDPFPFIRFNQQTGPELLEFLFGSEPIKQIAAKQKQKRAKMIQSRKMGIQGARKAAARQTSFSIASMAGITVTEDTLYLVLYGDMELTPMGWMRTGVLRCTFKRIE